MKDWWKTIMCAGVTIFLYILVYLSVEIEGSSDLNLTPTTNEDLPNYEYGLMLDAGSTGTRVHIYIWEQHEHSAGIENLPQLSQAPAGEVGWSKKINPGLSSYADTPSLAGASLKPLIDYAKSKIPSNKFKTTVVFLKATAGMRLLTPQQQTAVMSNVQDYLSNEDTCPFYFKREWARIISGTEEGIFGWVTVNYLLENRLERAAEYGTVGALDLGGASTQITFIPTTKPLANGNELVFDPPLSFDLYSYSFLKWGLNEAEDMLIGLLIEEQKPLTIITNPCFVVGYNETFTNSKSTYQVVGSGNFSQCRESVIELMMKDTPCGISPCSINGTYQPALPSNMTFYAFSGFYYIYQFFNLDSGASLSELISLTHQFCDMSWDEVKQKYPDVDPSYLFDYCFRGSYMYTLLVDGFGFNADNTKIQVLFNISTVELGWPLGAMLYEADKLPFSYCSFYTSCSECVQNSKCGWCASSKTCLAGNDVNPWNSKCSSWSFDSCKHRKSPIGYIIAFIAVGIVIIAVIAIGVNYFIKNRRNRHPYRSVDTDPSFLR